MVPTKETDERTLVARAATGSTEALGDIFGLYGQEVYRVAYR